MYPKDKRITIYDIADELGCSVSTVNRAINGKSCVKNETKELILQTAERLGYKANSIAKSLTRKTIKIGCIMNDLLPEYSDDIIRGAKAACKDLTDYNVVGEYRLVSRNNIRQNIVDNLEAYIEEGVNGVLFSPFGQYGFEDIINKLKENDIAVGTWASGYENANLLFSVRSDGERAGKIAADLFHISGLKKGDEIAILVGQRDLIPHKCCIDGFTEENKRYGFVNVKVMEHQDDPRIAYFLTEQFLRETPSVKGIYSSTAVSASVCEAVEHVGMSGKIKVICTELVQELVPYIEKGLVTATLFQDPYRQGKIAFKKMYEYITERTDVPRDLYINPEIVVQGNLDYYLAFSNKNNHKIHEN